ncbi:MAG: peptidase MA family metallohydrolase, partial [Candidatus Omnitrophota bacterium]
THLIFRDYVGFRGEVPVWLDEGVAQWQEPAKRGAVRQLMKFYFYDEKGYSLKNLTEIDVQNVRTKLAVDLFYTQSASVIDFLVTKYGGDRFVDFCRQLRDGKKMDEALPFAYPLQIRNLNELEEQWKQYILSAP